MTSRRSSPAPAQPSAPFSARRGSTLAEAEWLGDGDFSGWNRSPACICQCKSRSNKGCKARIAFTVDDPWKWMDMNGLDDLRPHFVKQTLSYKPGCLKAGTNELCIMSYYNYDWSLGIWDVSLKCKMIEKRYPLPSGVLTVSYKKITMVSRYGTKWAMASPSNGWSHVNNTIISQPFIWGLP